jgi:hypothetical protein
MDLALVSPVPSHGYTMPLLTRKRVSDKEMLVRSEKEKNNLASEGKENGCQFLFPRGPLEILVHVLKRSCVAPFVSSDLSYFYFQYCYYLDAELPSAYIALCRST